MTSNAPLRGGKSQLYEGGIRVPLIVSWPAQIPAGSVSRQPTANIDHYPTLLAAAGAKADSRQKLDGISLLRVWQKPDKQLSRKPLYWHYPLEKPHFLGGRSSGAIRDGDWKLIENFTDNSVELYHLANDPGEKVNLADQALGQAHGNARPTRHLAKKHRRHKRPAEALNLCARPDAWRRLPRYDYSKNGSGSGNGGVCPEWRLDHGRG